MGFCCYRRHLVVISKVAIKMNKILSNSSCDILNCSSKIWSLLVDCCRRRSCCCYCCCCCCSCCSCCCCCCFSCCCCCSSCCCCCCSRSYNIKVDNLVLNRIRVDMAPVRSLINCLDIFYYQCPCHESHATSGLSTDSGVRREQITIYCQDCIRLDVDPGHLVYTI